MISNAGEPGGQHIEQGPDPSEQKHRRHRELNGLGQAFRMQVCEFQGRVSPLGGVSNPVDRSLCGRSSMLWLKRWNFIERARLERELWDAFEAKEDIEAMVNGLKARIEAADPSDPELGDQNFRLEVWITTMERIRKIEALMAGKER